MIYFFQGIHPGIKANASLFHNRSVPFAVSALVGSQAFQSPAWEVGKEGQPYKRLALCKYFVDSLIEKENLFPL